MKQTTWLILFLLSLTVQTWAQESNRNQSSSVPYSSRFEIIQSELAVKITLKIDKYTGNVFQLVSGNTGLSWQLILADEHNQDKATKNKVNYQVFTSGLALRMTFLVNVNTGATWQLSEDKTLGIFWSAMK